MKAALAILLSTLVFVAVLPAEPAPSESEGKTYVVVFDLACAAGDYGAKISDSIRLRLRRHKKYAVVDRLTTQDVTQPAGADAHPKKVARLMTEHFAVTIGFYGTVTKKGNTFTANVVCIDLSHPKKPRQWTKTFSDSTQRAHGLIARAVVEAFTGQAEWTPPEYGDEAEPRASELGKPLNTNGGFDDGHKGWDAPDLVATFLVDGPRGRGTILRVRTDLKRDPWLAYRRRLRLGKTDPSRAPKVGRDTSYGSVAGLEGVHYRGEWIKAEPGQRYWLVADKKGPGGAKVFVKGFLDWTARADGLPESALARLGLTPRKFANLPREKQQKLIRQDATKHPESYRRECYRWYLNCGHPGKKLKGGWEHFAAPFPPRGGLPKQVQWLQIQVYSYWPPGEYLWDNVHVYKDPRQTAPLPEVGPRTPGYRPPTTRPAANTPQAR